MDHEQFLTMVAQIAHTDRDTAERASQTLHPPLHRGRDVDGLYRRIGPDEFTRRVARRAGLSLDEAARRIPAVFAVLRSLVGDEFFDLSAATGPVPSVAGRAPHRMTE